MKNRYFMREYPISPLKNICRIAVNFIFISKNNNLQGTL